MAQGYEILISDINRMLSNERVMIGAVNSVLASQKKRIFEQGKASDESKIGNYGTKPISISKSRQARQTGKTRFPGGYLEYKSLTGKEASFVNLQDTGQMMMDLGTSIVGIGEYGIGFSNSFNGDKSEWNEKKYKKEIFATTEKEDDLFIKVVEFELERI